MTAAIVNPNSAGGKTRRRWAAVSKLLATRLGTVKTCFTQRPGHAIQIASELLKDGVHTIIAAGGDGTVNEVANGFFADGKAVRPEARLGVLPLGTGGDFHRTLGLPAGLEPAVEVLAAGNSKRIDIGHAVFRGGSRYFINLTSFGMGGEVAARSHNVLSPISGKAAFLYATASVFLRYKPKTIELLLDGRSVGTYTILNVAIGNGRFHGGGMHVCPRADMSDGLLEVTVIDALGLLELARDLPVLYSDDIYRHPKVRHFRASRVEARCASTALIEVDGEPLGALPLEATLLPRAIEVIVP